MDLKTGTQAAGFQSRMADALLDTHRVGPYPAFLIKKEKIREAAQCLRKDFGFDFLMEITCVDYLEWEERTERFEVVYNVFSSQSKERVLLKVALPENQPVVDSVVSVWPAADWYEREIWDMFGVRFNGHPNLKRILMYEEFRGHPLRKDYPYNLRQPLVGPAN